VTVEGNGIEKASPLISTPQLGDEAVQVEHEDGEVEEDDAEQLDVVLDEPVPRLQRVGVGRMTRRARPREPPDQHQTHHAGALVTITTPAIQRALADISY